jgi:hypothetical protein
MEHERQRALHRKLFEDQMRVLEQQQRQELLSLPVENGNHFAVSAPTTPPRVNAVLAEDPSLRASYGHSVVGPDVDSLSQHFGSSNVDKRKSVTYAPMNRSPDVSTPGSLTATTGSGFARAVAKSMPASRRTSASEHDEDIASHLHNLSLAGEQRQSPMPTQQSPYFTRNGRLDGDAASYGAIYNAGMMLDEQLDQEMHSTSSIARLCTQHLNWPPRRNAPSPNFGRRQVPDGACQGTCRLVMLRALLDASTTNSCKRLLLRWISLRLRLARAARTARLPHARPSRARRHLSGHSSLARGLAPTRSRRVTTAARPRTRYFTSATSRLQSWAPCPRRRRRRSRS